MSYLTDGPDKRIQAAVETGVVPRLVELLSESFASNITQVLTPVLRTIGNIVTGNDFQTDCVINAGGLPNLRNLLSADKDNIVKEAAWSISNITAGNKEQIQAVIDAEILPPLINVLQNVTFLFSLSLILCVVLVRKECHLFCISTGRFEIAKGSCLGRDKFHFRCDRHAIVFPSPRGCHTSPVQSFRRKRLEHSFGRHGRSHEHFEKR